jgi:membrane-associated protease RseP (regulator of RpoE activity)
MRTTLLMLLGAFAWLAITDDAAAQYRYGRGPGFYGRPYAYGPYYRGFYGPYGGIYGPYGGYGFGISIYSSPWMYSYPSARLGGVVPAPAPGAVPPNGAEPAPAGETGLKIISVGENGSAEKAMLRVGDTILSVGTTRVRTLNDLRSALSNVNNGETEIVFINPENNKREKLPVKVVEGRIGINVEQVDLK